LAIFGSGYALTLSVISVYFKDMTYLWAIVTQVWFFLTPVVYPPEVIEQNLPQTAQNLLKLNPMAHFVDAYRDALYHATFTGVGKLALLISISFGALLVGWLIFNRLGRRLAEEV